VDMDISGLPSGNYIVRIASKTGTENMLLLKQ
jgi:hypothetical protein